MLNAASILLKNKDGAGAGRATSNLGLLNIFFLYRKLFPDTTVIAAEP